MSDDTDGMVAINSLLPVCSQQEEENVQGSI
jgi:hypothetical protein